MMQEQKPLSLNIKSWAEEDRPREKLLLKGIGTLSNAELIAIVIGSGTPTMSAVELGKLILNAVGNDLNNLAKLNINDLIKFKGIGEAKAIGISAAMELGRRRKDTIIEKRDPIVMSSQAYELMKPYLLDLPHEEMWSIALNRAGHVIKIENIGIGGVASVYADIKIILKKALENLASSIIIVHNHPSGQLKPSQHDVKFTDRIKSACDILDITLSDHIIFTNSDYYSFRDDDKI